jgi:hypothetical protein
MKMEGAYTSETSLSVHRITWYHNPVDHTPRDHRYEESNHNTFDSE